VSTSAPGRAPVSAPVPGRAPVSAPERGRSTAGSVLPRAERTIPQWRALLEARWEARLRELTELSLAYHAAEAEGSGDSSRQREAQALLRRACGARRKLANLEEALGRLTAGGFGACELCGSAIPSGLLAALPETRYCPRCDTEPARARATAEPA
jgi:DnaK suppressor protein